MTMPPRGQDTSVRIATFNILNGRRASEQAVDEQAYAAAIASLDADVLGLQEVDRDQPRSGGLDLTAIAAEAMGAVAHRFVPALSGTPGLQWTAATEEDPPTGPAYGIALLSRYPVTNWEVLHLPRLRIPPVDEERVAVVATVEAPTGRVRVATTHLSFVPWSNGEQLRALMGFLGTSEHPTVLTGDLNMTPARAARITGMRPLASGSTFPNPEPRVQLDHLLTGADLQAAYGGPVGLPISDHLALVADLG